MKKCVSRIESPWQRWFHLSEKQLLGMAMHVTTGFKYENYLPFQFGKMFTFMGIFSRPLPYSNNLSLFVLNQF